ncbi:MAG: hypothetical protein GXO30_04870 [Epsilonproteobacteria bacterium]|nr:hypothetical protein [Campylobacterota bacterium]
MSKPTDKQPPKVVTHDEFTESKMQELIEARLRQRELNEVKLAFIIQDLKVVAGKEKLDKDGNIMIDPSTGEPLRWDDSYYADIDFVGGSLAIRVKREQFNQLEIGKRFVGYGTIGVRTINNFSSLDVKFNRFEAIN